MASTDLDRAIEILGSQQALADKITEISGKKCAQQNVSWWVKKAGGNVPAEWCAAIERATGGEVRCEELCPAVRWERDASGRVTGYVVPVSAEAA